MTSEQNYAPFASDGDGDLFRQISDLSNSSSDGELLKQHLEKELKAKSAISLLQEFVQCSKDFQLPPRQPILRWHYETRVKDHSTLEFRSRALFLLAGALHHSVGTWQLSKKLAQRDAAERAIGFFLGHWCDLILAKDASGCAAEDPEVESTRVEDNDSKVASSSIEELRLLQEYSRCFQDNGIVTHWHEIDEDDRWQAFVEMSIAGVPHRFSGPPCSDQMEASKQAAKRVLWYLQHPDYVHAFEPDLDAIPDAMSVTPPSWTCDQPTDESQAVRRKTALMRIQNRLQQRLGPHLKPGQSVWEWSYDSDGWPPRVRASVHLAHFGREFTGSWVRSHRGAQLDTCAQVEEFLNQLETKL